MRKVLVLSNNRVFFLPRDEMETTAISRENVMCKCVWAVDWRWEVKWRMAAFISFSALQVVIIIIIITLQSERAQHRNINETRQGTFLLATVEGRRLP
jgi:hypothetical protein